MAFVGGGGGGRLGDGLCNTEPPKTTPAGAPGGGDFPLGTPGGGLFAFDALADGNLGKGQG